MNWMDDLFDNPVLLIGGCIAVVIVLTILLVKAENSDVASFQARCIAAGETPKKCEILSELKRSSDNASMMAAGALGMAAGRK